MVFTAKIEQNSWACMLILPEEIALKAKEKFGKRVLFIVKREHTFHGAIQWNSNFGHFLYFGKAKLKAAGLKPNEEVNVQLKKDESQYQFPVCEEWSAVMETDPEAQSQFEQLTDGKKRGLIHHINSAKRSETRINRALKIAENLKLGIKDQRELIR